MSVPAPALQDDSEVVACWESVTVRLLGAISDFNCVCRRRVWLAAPPASPGDSLEVRSAADPQNWVRVSLDGAARKIVCIFGPHARRAPLELGIAAGLLVQGAAEISSAAAMDLILMPLLPQPD